MTESQFDVEGIQVGDFINLAGDMEKDNKTKPWWAGKDIVGHFIKAGWKVEEDGVRHYHDSGVVSYVPDYELVSHDPCCSVEESFRKLMSLSLQGEW